MTKKERIKLQEAIEYFKQDDPGWEKGMNILYELLKQRKRPCNTQMQIDKKPNKVVEYGQAKWCPLFEECEFRQERGCDMKCRYYYPPAT